jgi:hypothetical protein
MCPPGGCQQQADTAVTDRNGNYVLHKTLPDAVYYYLEVQPPAQYPFVSTEAAFISLSENDFGVNIGLFEGYKVWLPSIRL